MFQGVSEVGEEAGGGQDARVSDPGRDAGLGHTDCWLDGGSCTGLGLYVLFGLLYAVGLSVVLL